MPSSMSKKGGKKIGRGLRSPSHQRYTAMNRWLSNKIRDLKKHIKKHLNDKCAKKALNDIERTV